MLVLWMESMEKGFSAPLWMAFRPCIGAGRATLPFAAVERSMRAGGNDPAALRDGAVAAMKAAVTGDQQQAAAARDRAAEALAKAQDIPVEQARTQITQYEKQYRDGVETAKREATEAAAVAAKVITRGALFAALALMLGAVAGWFGGRMGLSNPR